MADLNQLLQAAQALGISPQQGAQMLQGMGGGGGGGGILGAITQLLGGGGGGAPQNVGPSIRPVTPTPPPGYDPTFGGKSGIEMESPEEDVYVVNNAPTDSNVKDFADMYDRTNTDYRNSPPDKTGTSYDQDYEGNLTNANVAKRNANKAGIPNWLMRSSDVMSNDDYTPQGDEMRMRKGSTDEQMIDLVRRRMGGDVQEKPGDSDIAMLMRNPSPNNLRAFDMRFGKGAAAQVLADMQDGGRGDGPDAEPDSDSDD